MEIKYTILLKDTIYICNVYIVFLRAISNNIAPKLRIISSAAEGRGRKNATLRSYIVGYGPIEHHIYIPLSSFQIPPLVKILALNQGGGFNRGEGI